MKAEHRDRALHTDLIPRDIDHKSRIVGIAVVLKDPQYVAWCWVLEVGRFAPQGGMAEKRLARAGVIAIMDPRCRTKVTWTFKDSNSISLLPDLLKNLIEVCIFISNVQY